MAGPELLFLFPLFAVGGAECLGLWFSPADYRLPGRQMLRSGWSPCLFTSRAAHLFAL